MGCDIHMFAESKKENRKIRLYPKGTDTSTYETSGWVMAGAEFANDYADEERFIKTGEDFYAEKTNQPTKERNYDLFAVLADVRNGRGFAGMETGKPIKPIDDPRGVPDDASEGYRDEVRDWGGDGHSHSYFTLRELLDYDWSTPKTHIYLISPADVEKFKELGHPPASYWGGGGGIEIELADFEAMPEEDRALKDYAVRVSWTEPIGEACGHFKDNVIHELEKFASREEIEDYDNVRIVFFFDN